ncbi:choice-of-anchor D domain-containing protein [Granulosicoccus sp. 3-233]|uniref:choice-of-anchor D domain-containing protein n=1 Tax=Granulosicoccus sp. 3-233 TaxID=3417969 RepID=UPI003D349C32
MANKFLVRRGRAPLASTVLLLASMGVCWAQDTGDEAASVAEGDGSGRITVPLSGTATVSRIDNLSISPSQVEIGLVDVGQSQSKTFVLSHQGGDNAAAIEIGEATLFGKSASEFAAGFGGYQTLGPGQSIEVTVDFVPLSPGDKSAGLRLDISGSTSPYVVLFTGTARYPLTSDLGQSDQKLDFGEALQDTDSQKNVILSNNGDADGPAINVSAMQLSGTNADAFTINFSPVTLSPGEDLDVKIDMATDTVGFRSAQVEIFHDGNNGALELDLEGTVVTPQSVPVNFSLSELNTSQQITRGTTLQFGPDGKLYVGEMAGPIHVFDITRNGKDNYVGNLEQTINLVKNVPNHDDDGTPNNNQNTRTMTGLYVEGTAAAPVIYVSSSDPRQAAGPSGTDSNLDTNSGMLHKLTLNGNKWTKQDLVRGLPRSEENHGPNGLVKIGNKLYVSVGGHTNMGSPSNNFAELPEFALSAAVLVIDLDAIGNSTYDLPTLDGPADQHDPFGGHDGLNQAILETNGPVQIFAPGFRNAYDIVYTESGRFYVWDNGPNAGWGAQPGANCSNAIKNNGDTHEDGLHLIEEGYYGGHPNPTRGNKGNKFGGQSPIEGPANEEECIYKTPGQNDGALVTNDPSTNGLDEYTASNFGGAMKGDLIAAAFGKQIFRVQLNGNGTAITSKSLLLKGQGTTPLDLTTQGDGDVFPGTIWIVDNIDKKIRILEPSDY